MNKQGVLSRVLKRIPLTDAIEIIKDRLPTWSPEKKPKKKDDIKDQFLALDVIIPDDEIEDFVQMAVMKRNVGLPAYTYRIINTDFLNELDELDLQTSYNRLDQPFRQNLYTISTQIEHNDSNKLILNVRLKEYIDAWKTGINNAESLSAVYTSKVELDKNIKVVSVYSGNHQVQEAIVSYLATIMNWPLSSYRLKEFANQTFELGNASFKTAALLDLIYNRLVKNGIDSTFKELKFYLGGKRKKDGVRDVAIGGKDLLYSQLACEYIIRGSDIISFKVDMEYGGQEFSAIFSLKGNKSYDYDILKIVIVDIDDDVFKKTVMDIIQAEYIDMCNTGIANMSETKKLLESIYRKYQSKDQLLAQVIEENSLSSIGAIAKILAKLNEQDEEVIQQLKKFAECHQTILDTIGYDEQNEEMIQLFDFIGMETDAIDEDSYIDEDLQES